MKGLVADAKIQGQVEHLVECMQADAWTEFWQGLDLVRLRIDDVRGTGRLYLP